MTVMPETHRVHSLRYPRSKDYTGKELVLFNKRKCNGFNKNKDIYKVMILFLQYL